MKKLIKFLRKDRERLFKLGSRLTIDFSYSTQFLLEPSIGFNCGYCKNDFSELIGDLKSDSFIYLTLDLCIFNACIKLVTKKVKDAE